MSFLLAGLWALSASAAVLYAADAFGLCPIPLFRRLPGHPAPLEAEGASWPLHRWYCLAAGAGALAAACGWSAWFSVATPWALPQLWLALTGVSAAAAVDAQTHLIPNRFPLLLLAGRGLLFLMELPFAPEGLAGRGLSALAGALFGAGLLLLISRLTGGIGLGDGKLFGGIGFCIGFYGTFFTLLFSLVFCAAAGCFLLITRRGGLKRQLPFGPFVLLGLSAAVLTGFY